MDRAEVRRRTSSRPTSSPTRTRPVCTRHPGAKIDRLGQLRAGDGQGAREGRLRGAGRAEGRCPRPRQAARRRAQHVHRGVRRRALEWIGAVGEGWGAAMWDRPTSRSTSPRSKSSSRRAPSLRARAMRRRTRRSSPTPRHPDGGHHRPALGRWGRRSLRLLRHRTSSVGMTAAVKAADKVRTRRAGTRPHMLEASPTTSRSTVPSIGQGLARSGEDHPGDRLRARPRVRCAGGHGAVSRRDGLLRHAELHLAVRDAHRGRRDRRGDRRGRPRALRGRRRRRQRDQPLDRGGQLHGGIAQGVGQRSGRAPCTATTVSC